MRRELIQAIAVLAIALGAGMFAFGRHLDPPLVATNPVAMQRAMNPGADFHLAASFATGFGVCLMTFGALSIVIPWVNDALVGHRKRTGERAV